MTTLREGLPRLPIRMQGLPLDHRGYPVPWFVAREEGKPPDFRIMDRAKLLKAVRMRLCWVCGGPLGVHMTFVIGPMCAINRTSAEPPSHIDCALFSARACPFLSLPKAVRREANLPAHSPDMPGEPIMRNPGVALTWTTRKYTPFDDGSGGLLLELGESEELHWFACGRKATREEILASIESGLPILRQRAAESDGADGQAALERAIERAMMLVPAS